MIKKTDGVVLKSISYSDSSKILTVFTKDFGKISVIAKASKRLTSRNSHAVFLPGSIFSGVFYIHQTRKIQVVSEIYLKKTLSQTYNSLAKLQALYQVIELSLFTIPSQEPNVSIFKLMESFFEVLNQLHHPENAYSLYFKFFLEIVSLLGFKVNTVEFLSSGKRIQSVLQSKNSNSWYSFFPSNGGFSEYSEDAKGITIYHDAICKIIEIVSSNMKTIENIHTPSTISKQLDLIILNHLEMHYEIGYKHKCHKIFSKL